MTTSPGWQAPNLVSDSPGWSEPPGALAITIGTLRIRTGLQMLPDVGSRWVLRPGGLVGWRTIAEDRSAAVRHPSGDGLLVGRGETDARYVTVSALLLGATPQDVSRALDALDTLRRTTLIVNDRDRGLAREADVRLTQVQETPASPHITNITLSMTADDPLRSSTDWVDLPNGIVTLPNRGGVTAWPIIEIIGPHSPVTIQHPGGLFHLDGSATPTRRTIDCRNGALFNSAGVRTDGWSGAWPRVPKGGAAWTITGMPFPTSARAKRTEAWG